MAVLTANYAFNFDTLNWNFYIQNFNRDWLADDWESMADSRYSVFSTNDDQAFVQQGSGYATDDHGELTIGTTEFISEWVWPDVGDAELSYRFSDISVAASTVNTALRSETTTDEINLLKNLLAGNDEFNLSGGDDLARGFGGADLMKGGDGNDTLYGNFGKDVLWGQGGDDKLYGGVHNDKLFGHQGDDSLWGQGGHDVLRGGTGADNLYGGAGNDKVYGGGGVDAVYGGAGKDKLYGGYGDDTMFGNAANDTLYGQSQNDKLYGGDGADRLYGNYGHDTLWGQNGNDRLFGGNGNDVLRGGGGNDILTGGNGQDTFMFYTGDRVEDVTDFSTAGTGHDLVDLTHMAAITDWDDLNDNHMSQSGNNVEIDAGNGDVMILRNVTMADLTEEFFIFTL